MPKANTKKAYVCKITEEDQILVYDVIGAEYAEAALQMAVSRHRRKLANADAAASFGHVRKIGDNVALYKNGSTVFSAELLSKVLEQLSNTEVHIEKLKEIAALKDEMTLLAQALKRFSSK